MRIGIAQINTTVGDLAGNRRKILDAYAELVARGAQLVVFPELVTCGYPPRDLLFKSRFVPDTQASLDLIASAIGDTPALIGTVTPNPAPAGRPFFNAAAFCHRGHVLRIAHKCLLPTYDVFDEDRYFEPAPSPLIVEHAGLRIGITLCEDIWTHPALRTPRPLHHINPVALLAASGVDLMVNLSASPWQQEKETLRLQLVADTARALRAPVVYCNAIGGNDELIFDGRSLTVDAGGRLLARLASFREELRVVDCPLHDESLPPPPPPAAAEAAPEAEAELFDALVLGLRDYATKSGFKRALIALSGGIDSALVAAIAAEAFGPDNVTGIALPSAISSQHSRDDAAALARNLNLHYDSIDIAAPVAATETALAAQFSGFPRDVAEENIQARIRGVIMMALSNKLGALLLTTGNKSELAVGYCTLYGDMCGGLAVISDVFKTQVYALSRWINRDREIIPRSTIEKPPSAELRPGQVDQDSLPPYDILDAILHGYVERGLSRAELAEQGFDPAVVNDVVRKVDLNEYKRKQAAPGLKITPLAFGTGRRIPLVQRYVS
ncbi:NAD+ synthase [Geminisphaera colitermitum]|uniref:NAD+ synthase n=1 Tax=Geminisphaera colitermitum TaxID=1148786 RepID=UPI0005B82399|nr:NAD+ synthase [Geminisphaera colitermitum]